MGYSIGKVFRSIECEMRKYADVDSFYMSHYGYGLRALIRNIIGVLRHIRKNNYDLIHITGTEHYLLPFLNRYKTIVTVHDLGFYTNHVLGFKTLWKRISFISTLRFARFVVFISDKTKNETLNIIGLSKYCVVNNCYSPDIVHKEKKLTKQQIVLHIGTGPNKNLCRVVEALDGLPIKLKIIGKLKEELEVKIKQKNIEFYVLKDLSDEQIAEEYSKCDIVSFPSLSEGFGMPIIEGQAAGKIVVTSNLSPMKEIAGPNAIIVDPYDVYSIRKGFEKAMEQPNDVIDSGLQNVKQYSVYNVTKRYFELYSKMLI